MRRNTGEGVPDHEIDPNRLLLAGCPHLHPLTGEQRPSAWIAASSTLRSALPASSGSSVWSQRLAVRGGTMKLLLAEDDPMIGASMEQGLRIAGFTVDWTRDGRSAELALETGSYALLILDLGLPRQDGLTLLKRIRQADNGIPVLIVTARDAVADRVAGLDLGADDYLVKPFDLQELVARVRARIRQHAGRARPELRCGALMLNPLSREVRLDGRTVSLSQREFALLEALMERPGEVLSRSRLEECLYGWGEEVLSNAVEVHLHNLRRKLGAPWIRNVRGVGYRISPPE
jgi:DNA-binding response OmpR family regulator